VNAAQAAMVAYLNYMYDHSAVPVPLVTQISLPDQHDNLRVYYTILRTDGFARYYVTTLPAGTNAAQPAATPAGPTAAPAPTEPKAGETVAPGADVAVARGVLEVHRFDRANVVAAFAFSTLHVTSFNTIPTKGAQGNGALLIDSSSVAGEHVVLGLDYYFAPRDTYPGAQPSPWSLFGLFAGVSLNAGNNYLVGLTFEPQLGLNITGGIHWGREHVLQPPFAVGTTVADKPELVTEDRQRHGMFVAAGLDLQIFRKVFGLVTGIGSTGSGTTP
jgi:hypothetical protein